MKTTIETVAVKKSTPAAQIAVPAAKPAKSVQSVKGTGKSQPAKSSSKSTSTPRLGSLLGNSVCSVIAAMGKTGSWSFDEVQLALQHAKIKASAATIRTSLRASRNDKSRFVAPLTAEQLDTLRVKATVASKSITPAAPAAKGAK